MELKHVPVELAGVSPDQATLLVMVCIALVGVVILFSARREVAIFAVAAGLISAILMS